MFEHRNDTGLAQHPVRQPADLLGSVHYFYRDFASEMQILREIDRAHPTRTQFANYQVLRAPELGQSGLLAKPLDRIVREPSHRASVPSSARASRRYSSSVEVSSRSLSSTILRNSRRARAR